MEYSGQRGGSHFFAGLTDQNESYGRHVIERFARSLSGVETVVDLGAGSGADLETIKRAHPHCQTIAVEPSRTYAANLKNKVDQIEIINIERDRLPFASESIDLVMANQVMEHTKEVFWIFDQVFHSLKIGGHFLVGVPNIASLHNRLLLLAGIHPTQHKLRSAHVRPFSKKDTMAFLTACFPGSSVVAFSGAQFYPFPRFIARPLAHVFPTLAFSIFFLIRKNGKYSGEFRTYPVRAELETNFWRGLDNNADSMYG